MTGQLPNDMTDAQKLEHMAALISDVGVMLAQQLSVVDKGNTPDSPVLVNKEQTAPAEEATPAETTTPVATATTTAKEATATTTPAETTTPVATATTETPAATTTPAEEATVTTTTPTTATTPAEEATPATTTTPAEEATTTTTDEETTPADNTQPVNETVTSFDGPLVAEQVNPPVAEQVNPPVAEQVSDVYSIQQRAPEYSDNALGIILRYTPHGNPDHAQKFVPFVFSLKDAKAIFELLRQPGRKIIVQFQLISKSATFGTRVTGQCYNKNIGSIAFGDTVLPNVWYSLPERTDGTPETPNFREHWLKYDKMPGTVFVQPHTTSNFFQVFLHEQCSDLELYASMTPMQYNNNPFVVHHPWSAFVPCLPQVPHSCEHVLSERGLLTMSTVSFNSAQRHIKIKKFFNDNDTYVCVTYVYGYDRFKNVYGPLP